MGLGENAYRGHGRKQKSEAAGSIGRQRHYRKKEMRELGVKGAGRKGRC